MDFEEFLPKDEFQTEIIERDKSNLESIEPRVQEKIGAEQFYEVITGRQPDWQTIIYDLINSEQLDPWDIDLVILTKRFFEKILELEEQDYYISSKVLLAAALLLRIKSDLLLSKHIRSIDDILFGKKEEKKYIMERIEINEDDLPLLIPKTPLPRSRRVTLMELMSALSKAINTESRRIKKEVAIKRAKKLSEVDFPTFRKIDLKDRIKQFYAKILTTIRKISNGEDKELNKTCYTNLVGIEREEKLACFLPLLHLSNTKKLWLEQEKHLDEIYIFLYEYFDKNRDKFIEELVHDIEEIEKLEELADIDSDDEVKNKSNIEIARDRLEEKKKLAEDARKELEKELGWDITGVIEGASIIDSEEKIEKITGFSDEIE